MDTSFENSASWYDSIVSTKGHYYHQNVILPKLLKLMDLENKPQAKVLDLGCGQGILARSLPKMVSYLGIDLSESLVNEAKAKNKVKFRQFIVADVTKDLDINNDFTHGVMLLSLQNMQEQKAAIFNMAKHLISGASLFIVLNHPCFRIPRQSSWEIDKQNKLRYRRVNRYKSPLKIPIQTNPGKKDKSLTTWSFHHPIEDYFSFFNEAGFLVKRLEEWVSDKTSGNIGKTSKMENLARKEFPLFLFLEAIKYEK